ncbi:hypothetical protein EXIGLDRAFT_273235 [Exidia glandulosa HHB12029]|uniref:Uncharacterized protein n=1 Tax=Exidia glandulosa HHB12029 TaxID=1314781 RepID=A0A165DL53_EXIGL|nr:hypothetical protein EXIGLDRAFT_273235 [Exidia glandulosa HHB12029]
MLQMRRVHVSLDLLLRPLLLPVPSSPTQAHLPLRLAPHRIQSRKLAPGRAVSVNIVLQPPSTCILGALFVHAVERLGRPSLDNMGSSVCAGAYYCALPSRFASPLASLVATSLTTMRASYSSPVTAHIWKGSPLGILPLCLRCEDELQHTRAGGA